MSGDTKEMPLRSGTMSSTFSDEAITDFDPSSTAGLLADRLQAWKHACGYLEDYVSATEKVHKAHAKEYERVLKTISSPLKQGNHFDQGIGGVAGFFENMRVNTQAMVNSNAETEKTLKGTVLPTLERLHKEVKVKAKEVMHGAQKSAKEVEKARNNTQKHIELLGQHSAAFESTGGRMTPSDDPYILQRGVMYRLNKQVIEENNHRNDLIHVQDNFQQFEAHIISVIQQAMEAFNAVVGGQAEKTRALYSDMLGAAQRVPADFEWNGFLRREGERLVNPADAARSVDVLTFPNQNHAATKPVIEGTLERKSRNKLSWGLSSGYYVVTASKYLHEFKDDDNLRSEPKPELSMFLPEATIGLPSGDKFTIRGKDKSKSISSKLTGHSELSFKAHSAADAQKWFEAIRSIAGGTGSTYESTPNSPVGASGSSSGTAALPVKTDHTEQENGITDEDKVSSPTDITPTAVDSNEAPKESSAVAPDEKKADSMKK